MSCIDGRPAHEWEMSEPTWSVDDVLAQGPCSEYRRERLVELFAGRERVDAEAVATAPISAADLLPRAQWLPAIFASADRAVRVYASAALERAGLGEQAATLRALPQIVNELTAWSAGDAAWAARDAAVATGAAAVAARAAANAYAAAELDRIIAEITGSR